LKLRGAAGRSVPMGRSRRAGRCRSFWVSSPATVFVLHLVLRCGPVRRRARFRGSPRTGLYAGRSGPSQRASASNNGVELLDTPTLPEATDIFGPLPVPSTGPARPKIRSKRESASNPHPAQQRSWPRRTARLVNRRVRHQVSSGRPPLGDRPRPGTATRTSRPDTIRQTWNNKHVIRRNPRKRGDFPHAPAHPFPSTGTRFGIPANLR
jgi:hypothetical protein